MQSQNNTMVKKDFFLMNIIEIKPKKSKRTGTIELKLQNYYRDEYLTIPLTDHDVEKFAASISYD